MNTITIASLTSMCSLLFGAIAYFSTRMDKLMPKNLCDVSREGCKLRLQEGAKDFKELREDIKQISKDINKIKIAMATGDTVDG